MTRSLARRLSAILATMGLVVSTAACSSSGSNSQSLKGVTLTYWATNQASSISLDQKIIGTELAKFTKQTGIKVKLDVPTWPTLFAKIVAAIAAGDGPDVLNIGATWGAALQATKGFVALTPDKLKEFGGTDRFLATSLASAGAPGQPPIAVPLYAQSYGLYYNTKMFAAAGITSPPKTWAEYVTDAKLLTKPGQWGIAIGGDNGTINSHLSFFIGRQNGSELFSPSGKPQFDTPQEVAAVRQITDLMDVDHVVDPGDAEYSASQPSMDFASGKVAMLITQSAAQAYFSAVKFTNYAVAQTPTLSPTPPGGAPVESMVAGTNIGILKSSKHQAAALKLVQFMTSDPELSLLNADYGTIPPVASLDSASAFQGQGDKVFADIIANHSEPMPRVPSEGQMETLMGNAVSSLFAIAATRKLTDSDIESALKGAQEKMTP